VEFQLKATTDHPQSLICEVKTRLRLGLPVVALGLELGLG